MQKSNLTHSMHSAGTTVGRWTSKDYSGACSEADDWGRRVLGRGDAADWSGALHAASEGCCADPD